MKAATRLVDRLVPGKFLTQVVVSLRFPGFFRGTRPAISSGVLFEILQNFGGKMKRVSLLLWVSFAIMLALTGCGGGNPKNPVQLTGTPVMLQTGDAVNDQIAKFELTVSAIT